MWESFKGVLSVADLSVIPCAAVLQGLSRSGATCFGWGICLTDSGWPPRTKSVCIIGCPIVCWRGDECV